MGKIVLIFKKEVLEARRDSRTFYTCIITPLLIYPLLFITLGYFIQHEQKRERSLTYRIGVINESPASGLLNLIEATKRFEIVKGNDQMVLFAKEKVTLVLEIKESEEIVISYDGADKASQRALARIDSLISQYQDAVIRRRIIANGLPETILAPIPVRKENIAPVQRMGGFILGILIPYILIIASFQGAMRAAFDITTGEKERKTIETLLASDVKRGEIVMGKCLTTFLFSFLAATAGMSGLIITLQTGFFVLSHRVEEVTAVIPWLSCLLILVIMIPLLWLFSSFLIAVGSFARSTKQATTYGSYCLIGVIVLAVISVVRLASPEKIMFYLPVVNIAISQQQILVGKVDFLNLIIAIGSTIFYAGIAYHFAHHNFKKEEILLRI
ncbi:MAG TPA: ABC transporter permease [bacterium (Candidatus Stahlbacteria)]|nr:ABC transporter permease [Candidatus Stahlbacteria bacterium]